MEESSVGAGGDVQHSGDDGRDSSCDSDIIFVQENPGKSMSRYNNKCLRFCLPMVSQFQIPMFPRLTLWQQL